MQLVTKLTKGNTIRDKKNSIIRKEQISFSTPIKGNNHKQPKFNASDNSSLQRQSIEYSLTSENRNSYKDEQALSEPKNAFTKKCFQKRRQILPIQNLLKTYICRTPDKNQIYKHPENIEKSSERRKGVSSVRKTLKNQANRTPLYSRGPSSTMSISRVQSQAAFRSLSQSKRIKYSIIRGQDDC